MTRSIETTKTGDTKMLSLHMHMYGIHQRTSQYRIRKGLAMHSCHIFVRLKYLFVSS